MINYIEICLTMVSKIEKYKVYPFLKMSKIREIKRGRLYHIKSLFSEKELIELKKSIDEDRDLEIFYHDYFLNQRYQEEVTKKLKKLKIDGIDKIISSFEDRETDSLAVCYRPLSHSVERHYDGWSDWNILTSMGCDSLLKIDKMNIKSKSGDTIIFDGNHIYHEVEMSNIYWADKKLFIRGRQYKRITFQYRRKCKKLGFYRKKLKR
jgi:hypothetical protein